MSKPELKEKAVGLRMNGLSIKEVSEELHVSKSTASLWLRNLKLNDEAKEKLAQKRLLRYYKTVLRWQEKSFQEEKQYNSKADSIIKQVNQNIYHIKLFCALLYWCEGSKGSKSDLRFTNSDPLLIKTFVTLFRKSFSVNESKFRILMHLHEYHDEAIQKKFWSNVTKIPKNKFQKTYLKKNSGKRIREGYQGCISIKYYDSKIFKEIKAIYSSFCKNTGEW